MGNDNNNDDETIGDEERLKLIDQKKGTLDKIQVSWKLPGSLLWNNKNSNNGDYNKVVSVAANIETPTTTTTEKSMAAEFHKELERRQRKIDEDREFQRYTRHHDSWIIRDLSFRRAFQKRRKKLEQEQEEQQQQQQQQQQLQQQQQQQRANSNNID